MSLMTKHLKKRMKSIRDAEQAISHRVWAGVKHLHGKQLAAFILQNIGEGFGRGMMKELKENEKSSR